MGVAVAGVAILALPTRAAAQPAGAHPEIAEIRTSAVQRMRYLGQAVVWRPPATLAPADLIDGPPGLLPFSFTDLNPPGGWPCTFEQPGRELGGASPKFRCRTADGQRWKIKYWDPEKEAGNREVFAAVAASRLMWALGFRAEVVYPVTVTCLDCPADPMQGTGARSSRTLLGVISPSLDVPPILSGYTDDEGWSWAQLAAAIGMLPDEALRRRQRVHFDALTLLGVLVQHGDRKPGQQRLACEGPVDVRAGELRPRDGDKDEQRFTLIEREGATACARPVASLDDVGATFGGAGLATRAETAKANLREWQAKPVFKDADGPCRGDLIVSLAAGDGGEGSPIVSEEGRLFLAQQLRRLSRAQLRAIFTAARVDALGDTEAVIDPVTRRSVTGADAWVVVLEDKIRQIEGRRCPAS